MFLYPKSGIKCELVAQIFKKMAFLGQFLMQKSPKMAKFAQSRRVTYLNFLVINVNENQKLGYP